MTITMHLCRGNFRSTFISAGGGYEPIAEMLFNTIKVHGYFMEYDSARSGGFEPLRFVPKGKTVVLGLVTSKTGTLESQDEIKRRIDEAAKFVRHRPALPVAAMRLRLDRGRQYPRRGRAVGEAADDRGIGRGGLGQSRRDRMAGIVSGKVAIVTGAARGIGRGIALGLAQEGAQSSSATSARACRAPAPTPARRSRSSTRSRRPAAKRSPRRSPSPSRRTPRRSSRPRSRPSAASTSWSTMPASCAT